MYSNETLINYLDNLDNRNFVTNRVKCATNQKKIQKVKLMKIAITGASGFIGRNLCEYLRKNGHFIIAIVRSKEKAQSLSKIGCEIREGDVANRNSLETALNGAEAIIHLAALFNSPESSWSEYKSVNVNGVRNLLEIAKKIKVKRVIHCSTIGVAVNGQPPFSVDTPYCVSKWDKYESTKYEGEKLALDYYHKEKLPLVIIRPAQVYGPGDRNKAKFYKMVKKGITINPEKTLKHLIYVEDLCRAFELSLSSEKAIGEIFIVADDKALPLKKLISIVAKELNTTIPKILIPALPITLLCALTEKVCDLINIKPIMHRRSMDFFTKSVEFNIDRTKSILGFSNKVDVLKGVHQTAEWYRKEGLL